MKKNLTEGNIFDRNDILNVRLNGYIIEDEKLINSKYILVIKSKTPECLRLTIYPIANDRITKIIIKEEDISKAQIDALVDILKDFNILHTSGLTSRGSKLIFECYLDYYEIFETNKCITTKSKIPLDKLKKLIKNIKIEEISLQKRFS